MRAAPCGGDATRRRTFISWAEWLCDSLCLSFSISVFPLLFLPPLAAAVLPLLFFSCQRVQGAPHTVKGRPMDEWGEVEVNCGEIWDELWGNPWHRLYRSLPPPLLFYISFPPVWFLCFSSRHRSLAQSCCFVSPPFHPSSLLTWNIHFRPMKYGKGPHELFTG